MNRYKTGYHYTSYLNWLKIKKEGLVPYNFEKVELKQYLDQKVIYIYKNKMKGVQHTGAVLYQASTKATPKIVLLKVKYKVTDGAKHKGHLLDIYHAGELGNWHYHNNEKSTNSILITKPIPPGQIKLIKQYDLIAATR